MEGYKFLRLISHESLISVQSFQSYATIVIKVINVTQITVATRVNDLNLAITRTEVAYHFKCSTELILRA